LAQAGHFLVQRGKVTHAVVITDDHVEKPHAMAIMENLAQHVRKVDLIVVESGESSKSIESATALWQGLLELNADRKTVIVAVGGGVIGDLAGFVAATFARGLRFMQVPTSLLAQVDSSVGGKVGINLPDAKNMVGSFLQPLGVLIDTATLESLPEREYISGLAEVVKYGMILDAEFFAYLEKHREGLRRRDPTVLAHTIARCCRLKADVVEKDEREETGLRAVLNYGHTFGHAFESLAGYGTLLHGEAVSIGMVCAARLAERVGRIDRDLTLRQQRLLADLQLPLVGPRLAREKILEAMMHDKKVQYGKLRVVLPSRLGHVDLVTDLDPADVMAALDEPT
jgi:3-dehydroquinate synthase